MITKVFKSSKAAIDLSSIMVGVIIVGLIAGIIAATIFAIIPWAQDAAAKESLEAVKKAQQVAITKNGTYFDTDGLTENKLITKQDDDALEVGTNTKQDCYVAFMRSGSGNIFYVTSLQQKPTLINAVEKDTVGCVKSTPNPEDNVPTHNFSFAGFQLWSETDVPAEAASNLQQYSFQSSTQINFPSLLNMSETEFKNIPRHDEYYTALETGTLETSVTEPGYIQIMEGYNMYMVPTTMKGMEVAGTNVGSGNGRAIITFYTMTPAIEAIATPKMVDDVKKTVAIIITPDTLAGATPIDSLQNSLSFGSTEAVTLKTESFNVTGYVNMQPILNASKFSFTIDTRGKSQTYLIPVGNVTGVNTYLDAGDGTPIHKLVSDLGYKGQGSSSASAYHTFPAEGIYKVTVYSDTLDINLNKGYDPYMTSIDAWYKADGDNWAIANMFSFCSYPNLTKVAEFPRTLTSLEYAFSPYITGDAECHANPNLNVNEWDISKITKFNSTFVYNTSAFYNLSSWDLTGKETNMIFYGSTYPMNDRPTKNGSPIEY